MPKCRRINLSFDTMPEFHCFTKKRWNCEQHLGNCKIECCCTLATLSTSFAARDVLTKVHLQECFTANVLETKPYFDMVFAP